MSAHAVRQGMAKNGQLQSVINKAGGVLQRKCSSCGNHTIAGGECNECSKGRRILLQPKLAVNEPGDIYEEEADRIADQVLTAPIRPDVSHTPPRIQRLTGRPAGRAEALPESVGRVLASQGSRLEPALQQDMEQRFGYDFSGVRIHSDGAAQQSARELNANAYTVGSNIAFGAGRFAPQTHEGRQLITHELTHVVQQGAVDQVGNHNHEANEAARLSRSTAPVIQLQRTRPHRLRTREQSRQQVGFLDFLEEHPSAAQKVFELNAAFQELSYELPAAPDFIQAGRIQDRVRSATEGFQRMDNTRFSVAGILRWLRLIEQAQGAISVVFRVAPGDGESQLGEKMRRVASLRRQVWDTDFIQNAVLRRRLEQEGSEVVRSSSERRSGEGRQREQLASEDRSSTVSIADTELYSNLRDELASYIDRNSVQENQGVHLGPIVDILVRSLGQDQERLANFFRYLQRSAPGLLQVVLLRGRTARAFTGERPILPSLARVLTGILSGVVLGDVRDVIAAAPTEMEGAPGAPQPSGEPLGEFGGATEAEESRAEEFTTEGGILTGAIVVGLIPVVGQIADVRDLGANLHIVYSRPPERTRWERWLALVGAAIGAVPAIGDALKHVSRWLLNTRLARASMGIGRAIASRASEFLMPLVRALGGRISRVRMLTGELWQSTVVNPTMAFWHRIQPVAERIAQSVLGVSSAAIAAVRSAAQRMFPILLQRIRTGIGDLMRFSSESTQAIAAVVTRGLAELHLQFTRFRSIARRITPTGRMMDAFSGAEEAQATARRLLDSDEVEAAQEALTHAEGLVREALHEAEDILHGSPMSAASDSEDLLGGRTVGEGDEVAMPVRAETPASVSPAGPHDTVEPPTVEATSTRRRARGGRLGAADEIPTRHGITESERQTRITTREVEPGGLQADDMGNLSRSTLDGEHTLTLTRRGRLVRCSSCKELAVRYEIVLQQDPNLRAQLENLQERASAAFSTGNQQSVEVIMVEVTEFEGILRQAEQAFDEFRGFTDDEFDAAFAGMTRPRITGGSRPRIGGHRIPTRSRRRLDIEDVTRSEESYGSAVLRIREVIGRRISDTPLARAWDAARTHVLAGRPIDAITRDEMLGQGGFRNRGLYDRARDYFWQNIRNDASATDWLHSSGFELRGDSGAAHIRINAQGSLSDTAERLISDIDTRISLDHILEKAEGNNWRFALDAENLGLEFHDANSYREIVQMRHPELRD